MDRRTRVLTAHGDAWQVHGRLRAGALEVPGARLMASGLPTPQWNNADVHDVAAVDVGELASWYDDRRVPWGVRVPAGSPWPTGEFLFRKRMAGLDAGEFRRPVTDVPVAAADDLDEVLDLDHAVYGGDRELTRRWMAPLFDAPEVTVAVARASGRAAGTGYTVRSDGWAGPALYLVGLAVLPDAPDGTLDAVAAFLLTRGFEAGAEFAHHHPDEDDPVRWGFTEVEGFDVYLSPQQEVAHPAS